MIFNQQLVLSEFLDFILWEESLRGEQKGSASSRPSEASTSPWAPKKFYRRVGWDLCVLRGRFGGYKGLKKYTFCSMAMTHVT